MNPRRSLGARLGWDGEVVGLPEPRQEFVMDAEGKELLPHVGEHWRAGRGGGSWGGLPEWPAGIWGGI